MMTEIRSIRCIYMWIITTIIINVIIIFSLLFVITFMQGIDNYTPETNHDFRVYSVVAILQLQFMVLIILYALLNILYFYISSFQSKFAVPNVAVFCTSLVLCFPSMLLRYCVNDFEMAIFVLITAVTTMFTFHLHYISIVRSSDSRLFLFLFLPPPPLLLLHIITFNIVVVFISQCCSWFSKRMGSLTKYFFIFVLKTSELYGMC